jgi:ATP adenylyltransferase
MSSIFEQLSTFILKDMTMSHIYQPVMLKALLNNQGTASVTEIARALLCYDQSQVEYYENVTKTMVGRVLTKKRGITHYEKNRYFLLGFEQLTPEQVQCLVVYCDQRLDAYVQKRGDKIWKHRSKTSGYIPGSIRYQVLKRAKGRCELCGVPAEKKAIEVDHILPRNKGGSDDISNLQALCYSCNAMKRDTDATDFRNQNQVYEERAIYCGFCGVAPERIVSENELAFAMRDAYPVTPLHTLVIPKRHVVDFFDLFQPERNAIHQLLDAQRHWILKQDLNVSGFNVGNNAGQSAGQTIMHAHTHLIPRRFGDMPDPRGGIRGVIPEKQTY